MLYIIIPAHNRKEITQKCLIYLKEQTFKDFRTIVVDDGSSDGTSEMIKKEFPEISLLKGDGTLWWTGSINLGVKYALSLCRKEDYILMLNDDIVIGKDYLLNLMHCVKKNKHSLIGSLIKDIRSQNILFPIIKKISKRLLDEYDIYATNRLVGRGLLIPVEVFNKIGLFDENLRQYGADEDYTLLAKKAGFKLIVCLKCIIYTDDYEKDRKRTSIINPFKYIKWIFASNNPFNLHDRYIFNKKHSKFWVITFTFDVLKIILRYPRNILKILLDNLRFKKKFF